LWGYLIAESFLNFGGGEKDLFLLIPWMIWSLFYLAIFMVAWGKRWTVNRGMLYAVVGATAGVILIWLVLLAGFSGLLGVA
jgi:hypothetical protein